MFTESDLDQAKHVAFYEDESKMPLNVGTVEMPNLGLGPYLMTPSMPFGNLSGGNDAVAGLRNCARMPYKNLTIQYGPRTWPNPISVNDPAAIWHQYGDGTL